MTDTVDFLDESLDRSILRRADYDDTDPKDLVLTIPKRDGGKISVPLLKHARSNIEREDYQENTLLRIKPLAEIADNLPVQQGRGAPIYQGKGVALLRPGFLYIFCKDKLWRELEINQNSQFSDVDLQEARAEVNDPQSDLRMVRPSAGQWLDDVLVPVFLQGQAVMHDFRMAYSEVQWDWSYIQKLEENDAVRNARTTGVGHAWAATSVDSLSFETGFPASRVENAPELRHRDLGIELMIEDPSDFVLSFEGPSEDDLCSKLAKLLVSNEKQARESARRAASRSEVKDPVEYTEQLMKNPLEHALEATAPDPVDAGEESEVANILELSCPQGADLLQHLRSQRGVVCVAIPDLLFRLRHSLAQLQLALHYLDALDVSIQERPLVHSAMLIRQTVFDPNASDSAGQLRKLRAAVDQDKLHKILEQSERRTILHSIEGHLTKLEMLVASGEFDLVCGDYLHHRGLGPCEAFSIHAGLLDIFQQLPGVFRAQGVEEPITLSRVLKLGLEKSSLIDALANGECEEDERSLLAQLRALSRQGETLTDRHLNGLGLSAISTIAQQLKHEEADSGTNDESSSPVSVGSAGTVAGMVETALSGWSGAVLKVTDRLRESGELTVIRLDRVFTAVSEAADIADPKLGGELRVMRRDAVDPTRYSIVGVHGKGLSFGLTDADLQSEALTRRNDYLFADRVDAAGKKVASTSPARLADEVGDAVVKAAAHTWVFVLPIDHPEAVKFSAWKFDWANKAKAVADGPGLSRVLVGLAAFNVVSEMLNLKQAKPEEVGYGLTKFVGAGLDLSAALMKLHAVNSPAESKLVSKVILRPLFEVRSIPVLGPLVQQKLMKDGASTIVRSMSLVNFFAASFMVTVSAWDVRNSVSRGDMDAALGHALAVIGGSVFAFSKLMTGMLLVPGWGWALLGLGLVLGGSIYAAVSTDSEIEQVLKRGPLGIGPSHAGLPDDDVLYYAQLLTLFAPISISAKRYDNLSDSEKRMFSDNETSRNDYRITLKSPIISRFKIDKVGHKKDNTGERVQHPSLRLGVQELEYTHSTVQTSKTDAWNVENYRLSKSTPLKRIKSWVAVPEQNAVHFLVERNLVGGEIETYEYRERRTISLRVVMQAYITSEIGEFRYPTPALDEYKPFDSKHHAVLPGKKQNVLNPFDNDPVPYWIIKEVAL
ncbi:toxin VasX [Marinobacter sp. bablab_jr008]|uniref:toxin VasX n=1 Tax=Marinobacter sp. bablab_jr008 TaxID=2755064 RepID=UPI0018F21615|nr:toxin VasX [Marinobacter sp. bablab_jr008]MEC9039012.1 toxin VasX [Pseudomonadota bacterium]